MCYSASTPKNTTLHQYLSDTYQFDIEFEENYHVSGFNRPFLPVTLNEAPRTVELAQWKLLPFWVKNEEEAKKYANTLNAESSEIFEKPSYRSYIPKYRGLLWVNGFYEPHLPEGEKVSQSFYVRQPDHGIFSMGIVYAPWTNKETGELINTFSILTVPANKLLAEIHNEKKRMPLIIAERDRDSWMNAETREEIESFFKPAPDGMLEGYRLQTRVTANIRGLVTNVPEIQDPFVGEEPRQPELF